MRSRQLSSIPLLFDSTRGRGAGALTGAPIVVDGNPALSARLLRRQPSPAERPPERVLLSGALIDRIDLAEAAAQLRMFLSSGRLHQVVTVNLDLMQIARTNATFRETD